MPPGRTPDRRVLERMAASIGHRGPDDAGIEVLDTVGLVHTRLSIVDPSAAGHEPMAGPDGRWWITYNGEIFNHLELRGELGARDWHGTSDTETLVHALDAWGEAAIPRCNGLYAYAALDRERRRLLLVRDRFGVKPLYWARHDGGLWFASEVATLLAAGVPRRARRDVLAHAVEVGWANGPLGLVDGVRQVMPGSLIEISLDTLDALEREWYDPLSHVDPERAALLARMDRVQAADELEAVLRTSVRRRLMADVPVGTMCSGGIDSSLLTAFARDEQPHIHAFNASVSDQPENDESAYAERVAEAIGVPLHTVQMTGEGWRSDLVQVVRHIECPLTHMSSVPMSQIAGLARDAGVKVLLSGEGADELLGGYFYLTPSLLTAFQARSRRAAALRDAVRRVRGRVGLGPEAEVWPPLGPSEEVRSYEAEVERAAERAYEHSRPYSRRALEAQFASYLRLYLPHLLNRQDKSTMLRSIETRVPFLDPDVVELSLNLPLEMRVEPERKALLRDLADRHLPEGIAHRKKVGFGWDVNPYLLPHARDEFLRDGMLREELGVSRGAWAERVEGLEGFYALLHWTGEIWCRQVLANESDAQVESALWR